MPSFQIGQILSHTFRTLFANFLPFMIITAVILLPSLIFSLYTAAQFRAGEMNPWYSLGEIATSLFVFLATGAVTYGVFEQLRGQPATIADCVGIGLKRLLPVLGVALLSGVVVFGGLLLLVIPGIIAYVMLYVAVPCAIVERPGVVGALRRSHELTSGYRWPLFGLIFLLGLIQWALAAPMTILFLSNPFSTSSVLLQWLVEVFGVSLQATAMALVYYQLRSIKEQFDVEQIAAVFA